MMEDNSMEFDMLEDARRKLVETLTRDGRDPLVAERIALYVIQGLRETPKLLDSLSEFRSRTDAETMRCLRAVMENVNALEKARDLFFGIEEPKVH